VAIVVDFEKQRKAKGLTVSQLADLVGITQANLFVLKSNRGKAIRFSTLEALCKVLECQPGDILKHTK
jgi:putative transcriptional regulator